MAPHPEALLAEWFGVELEGSAAVAERCAIWFQQDAGFDRELQYRFGTLPELAFVALARKLLTMLNAIARERIAWQS